jgi:hypothetical protein
MDKICLNDWAITVSMGFWYPQDIKWKNQVLYFTLENISTNAYFLTTHVNLILRFIPFPNTFLWHSD